MNPDQDAHQTSIKLDPCTSQSTICCHNLKKIDKVSKLGIWVSHTLSEKNKQDHISRVTSLFSRQRNDLFHKNIIISDEKMFFFLMTKDNGLTRINLYSLPKM